jgi:hypothetical protein
LLRRLEIGSPFIYLHDWEAPVGLQIAMQAPDQTPGARSNRTPMRTERG